MNTQTKGYYQGECEKRSSAELVELHRAYCAQVQTDANNREFYSALAEIVLSVLKRRAKFAN